MIQYRPSLVVLVSPARAGFQRPSESKDEEA
jgi:hypothetical protein